MNLRVNRDSDKLRFVDEIRKLTYLGLRKGIVDFRFESWDNEVVKTDFHITRQE